MDRTLPERSKTLAIALLDRCRARGILLGTAESCTGGLIAATLTEIAGSSDVVERGYVTYSNGAKISELGVPGVVLAEHGAVSEAVARAMADGVLNNAPVALSMSVTGIAGPGGGTATKPVGLVFIGCACEGRDTAVERHVFPGSRSDVRWATVTAALELALRQLED